MAKRLEQNMGPLDRGVRGGMGAFLLLAGLLMPNKQSGIIRTIARIEMALGGAFLLYGVTGFDPLLAAAGATTRKNDENFVVKKMKQALPGQGIHPMSTQQAAPQQSAYRSEFTNRETVRDMLSIP
jgi:uncharacterized membrane protein